MTPEQAERLIQILAGILTSLQVIQIALTLAVIFGAIHIARIARIQLSKKGD